jgi:hypothetical protein
MSDDVISLRLRRDWAQFLQKNLFLMLERTHDAMAACGVSEERRAPLQKRAILLAKLDDVVRDALIG